MPVDLKDRSDEDSGIHPDWYRPEADPLEEQFNAPSASDEDLPEGHPSRSDSKTASSDELAAAEATGGTPAATGTERSEAASAAPNDTAGRGFREEDEKRFRFTKKHGIAGGIIGILVGGGFGIMSIITGPLQLMQMSNILSSFFDRNDSTNDIGWRRLYNTISGQSEQNNLGIAAAALANRNVERLKEVGITPNFLNDAGRGRSTIQSLSIDTSTPEGKRLLGRAMTEGFTPRGNVAIETIDLRTLNNRSLARALTDEMISIDGKKGLAGKLASRRLKKLFGVNFHPMNIAKKAGESAAERLKRRKVERAEEHKSGQQSKDLVEGSARPNEDGTPGEIDTETRAEADAARQIVDEVDAAPDLIERRSILRNLKTAAGPLAAAGAIVSVVCSVKDLGDSVVDYKITNIIAPVMRLAMQFISFGDQTKAMQDISMEELQSAADPLWDEETGTSAFGAEPILKSHGQDGGTPVDPATKAQLAGAYNGDKSSIFAAVDSIPFVDQACEASNWFGNIPLIREVGKISGDLMSGLTSVATGKSVDEWMGELVAMLSGDAVDVLAEGGALGGLLPYGAVFAANSNIIPISGIPLTGAQAYEWRQYLAEERQHELNNMSIAQRLFSPNHTESLVSKAVVGSAPYASGMGSSTNIARAAMTSLPNSLFSSLSNIFTSKTSASIIRNYDYGVPEYGVPLSTLTDPRYDNVFDNIDQFHDNNFAKLKEANSKWGKCFGNPIDDEGNIKQEAVGGETYKELNSSDCTSSYETQEFKDFQMYLLNNQSIKSAACYGGVDEGYCTEIGATGGSGGSSSTTASTTDDTASGGKDVYIIGDALTRGMINADLEERLETAGYTVTGTQAFIEETAQGALTKLTADSTLLRSMNGTIVIGLGTTEGQLVGPINYENNISELVNAIRRENANLKIAWVNAYGPGHEFGGINTAIAESATALNFTLLDWRAEAKQNPSKYEFGGRDGIFMTPGGYAEKANWLVKSLGIAPNSDGVLPANTPNFLIPTRGAF